MGKSRCKQIKKNKTHLQLYIVNYYSGSSPNGHPCKRTAPLTAAFQNPIFDNSNTNSVFLHSVSGQLQLQTVILLQIVMASHGTHLVKNHESLSITDKSQFKKKQDVQNYKGQENSQQD